MFSRLALFDKISNFLTCRNLLTLICMVPTGLLLHDIVADFLVRKPTAISQNQIDFNPRYFPDLLICRHPPINKDVLKTFGYQPVFFWQGRTGEWDNGKFIGWNGLSGNQNITTIVDKAFPVMPDTGLIKKFWFFSRDIWKLGNPSVEFRMLRYPHWRCQFLRPSSVVTSKESSFLSLEVNTSVLNLTSTVEIDENSESSSFEEEKRRTSANSPKLDILLIDPVNSPLIFLQNFQMIGDPIRVPFDFGWRLFTIKIHRYQYLKDDPHFECEEYTEDFSFGDCITKELRAIYKRELNCTPPLLARELLGDFDAHCQKIRKLNKELNNRKNLKQTCVLSFSTIVRLRWHGSFS